MMSVEDNTEGIINAVQAAGQIDNTYFFFVSDNGYCIGEHGVFGKNVPWECSGQTYLVVRGPSIPEGETRDQLVGMTDLTATICELAGCTPGWPQDGASIMPIIADQNAAWRGSLFFEGSDYSAVRSGSLKYIKRSNGNEALFDLVTDSYEMSNLVANPGYASALATMRLRTQACKVAPVRIVGFRDRNLLANLNWSRATESREHVAKRPGRLSNQRPRRLGGAKRQNGCC